MAYNDSIITAVYSRRIQNMKVSRPTSSCTACCRYEDMLNVYFVQQSSVLFTYCISWTEWPLAYRIYTFGISYELKKYHVRCSYPYYHETFVNTKKKLCSAKHSRHTRPWNILSASLYVSKRGAYWDRLCRDVVGRWLVGRLVVGWLSHACTVAKRCILGL